jgi:tetratricopeptide (TPR) repeat protein
VYLAKGEFEKTIECGRLVQRIAEAVKNIHGLGWAQVVFAFGYLPQGKTRESLNHAQEAIRQCEMASDYLVMAMSLRVLGQLYLSTGQIDEALTALEKSRAIIEQNTLLHDLSTGTYVVLAEAYLQAARADEANRKTYLKKARRCLIVALILAKLFKNWSVPAYRVKGIYEWTRGKKTLAKRSLQKSLDVATKLGARYELGRTYLEFGKRLLNEQRS